MQDKLPKFLTDLEAKSLGGTVWSLLSVLMYSSPLTGIVSIPVGFETDLDSIPRWIPMLYALLKDRATRPFVLHDYLFRKNSIPGVSFGVANRVMLEAMKVEGISLPKRWLIYWGVCLGGRASYHKKTVMAKWRKSNG